MDNGLIIFGLAVAIGIFSAGMAVGQYACGRSNSTDLTTRSTGLVVRITAGKGHGQIRRIVGITVDPPFVDQPDATTEYVIE